VILPRVYPILDTARHIDLFDAAQALADGGAALLQIRHKGDWNRKLFATAERIAKLSVSLIVNDRADIAKMLDCGVHVGQTDLPPANARAIVGTAVVGYSTHNRKQLEAATGEPIDYVALGPIFQTGSKENPDPVVGLESLRQLRPLSPHPLVAIGGITRSNAVAIWNAGADSLAIIGDLYPEPLTPVTLRNRMEEWRTLAQS
jgi:thiamine-phosphate pyrophosphorylase